MIAVPVSRIIADYLIFLNFADEDILDPDVAVKVMEGMGENLEGLDHGFLRELIDAFAMIASEYSGEVENMVRNIPLDFYLEDVLAADDPVRLSELDALRDAQA